MTTLPREEKGSGLIRPVYALGGSVVAVAGALFILSAAPPSGATSEAFADARSLGISEYMLVVHGPKGLSSQLKESVGGSGPADDKAWKAVSARVATMAYLTDRVLAPAKPEKGDAASWKAKVGAYAQLLSALGKAAGARDTGGVKAELDKLGKSCDACHKAHK